MKKCKKNKNKNTLYLDMGKILVCVDFLYMLCCLKTTLKLKICKRKQNSGFQIISRVDHCFMERQGEGEQDKIKYNPKVTEEKGGKQSAEKGCEPKNDN